MTSAVVGLITFIVGCVAGYFAQRVLSASPEQEQLQEQIIERENALAQYKQDVAEHLEKSASLLEQMNSTCQTAMQQMEQSTKLLQQATPVDVSHMPFFSQETQQQLAATVNERHPRRREKRLTAEESIAQAPLDYSSNPSGLFADQKQSVTNAE